MTSPIALIFTGGTISMIDDGGGAVPTLGADALSRLADQTGTDVVPIDWGLVPGAHFTTSDLFSIAESITAAIGAGAAGVVVVQGTDTIEESAWAWELMRAWEVPVVVTGAMRNASEADFDGPRNLHDAVTCARALSESSSLPVLVSMAGDVHAAREAIKVDAARLDSFSSDARGPVGRVDGDRLTLLRPLPVPAVLPSTAAAQVDVVSVGIDSSPAGLEAAIRQGAAGIVLEAPGQGHTSAAVYAAGSAYLASGGTLIVSSRCILGPAVGSYGFTGGGRDWAEAGAIFAGRLTTWKARMAASLVRGAGLPSTRLRSVFDESA